MNKLSKLLFFTTIIIIISSTAYAIYTFSWTWAETEWIWWKNDQFKTNDSNVILYNNTSPEYVNENKRFYLWSDTTITSEHYWEFAIKSWTKLIAYKKNWVKNSACTKSNISYYFSWTLLSKHWWELEIENNANNYYCPTETSFSIPLNSTVTWPMTLSSGINDNTLDITDSYWNIDTISISNVFDNKKISINGIYKWNGTNLKWELSDSLGITDWVEVNGNTLTLDLKKSIDKNIKILTKNSSPETGNNLNNLNTKNLYYYNYNNTVASTFSNKENKWQILTIWTGWNPDTFKTIEVNWWKTIIVEWWNIYINADIYNKDKNSLLVIIAKRDSSNMKNWWNIYINPNVTNIDAVLISEGSMLSFDWTKVLTIDNDESQLKKQLLIYGAIYTKNTIWKDESIYGTDDYILNWWIAGNPTKIYNLENLRTFQTTLSYWLDSIIKWSTSDDPCYNSGSKVTAIWSNETSSTQYAFAWKKECYANDTPKTNLRSTDSFAKLVIQYNPIISSSNLPILQIK
jgi:hypothetical protein